MSEEFDQESNKTSMKRALCYVPMMAIVFSVIEKDNAELTKDIRYGVMLFFVYVLASIIGSVLGLWVVVFLLYILGSGYLGYKAFNKEEVTISFLDQTWEAITGKNKK